MTWPDFCQRYEEEHLSMGAASTVKAWKTPRNWYTRLMNPQFLDDLTPSSISRFAALLKKELETKSGKSGRETTVASYLKQLSAALGWAESVGMIDKKVKIRFPRRAKGQSKLARSRAITLEEFERVIATVPKVRTHKKDAAQWQRFLCGLWESGFRLNELVELSWDREKPVSIDTLGKLPMVRFLAAGEKAHTDRLQPITPEFWALLNVVPSALRRGRCFPLTDSAGNQYDKDWIGRTISKIGRRAGVKTGFADNKCASSHDIGRRGLTTRLAAKLSESELAEWMRHKAGDTTRRYYYTPTVEALAMRLWSAQGDTLGDTEDENVELPPNGCS